MAGTPQHDRAMRALAAARWPGYTIEGDGSWACVDSGVRAVKLFAESQPAHWHRSAARSTRSVYRLEVMHTPPKVWEKDDYDGPVN